MSATTLPLPAGVPLPAPPPGWFDVEYAVLEQGSLAILRSDSDIHGNRTRTMGRLAVLAPETRGYLSIFDGVSERRVIEFAIEEPWLVFDRLPDGHWIIASSRCPIGHLNARLLSPRGDLLHRFWLGDGIEHLQCDASGLIWVSYFDEGILRNYGWDAPGTSPIGASGLVKFDPHGSVIWRFIDAASNDTTPRFDSCYALNVTGNMGWVYYYSGFPIVEINPDGMRHYDCPIAGGRALAFKGAAAVLAGGYGANADQLVLLALEDGAARFRRKFRLELPEADLGTASLLHGRGDTIHIVRDRRWFRVSVADVRDRATYRQYYNRHSPASS